MAKPDQYAMTRATPNPADIVPKTWSYRLTKEEKQGKKDFRKHGQEVEQRRIITKRAGEAVSDVVAHGFHGYTRTSEQMHTLMASGGRAPELQADIEEFHTYTKNRYKAYMAEVTEAGVTRIIEVVERS